VAPASGWMGCQCVPFPPGSRPRKPRSSSATLGFPRPTASPATYCVTQAVLGQYAKALGSLEGAAHLGDTTNGRQLASCQLSVVLEVDLTSQTKGRVKACKQGNSSPDFSNGCREPNLGRTAYSWRVTHVGLRGIGTHGFAVGAASA